MGLKFILVFLLTVSASLWAIDEPVGGASCPFGQLLGNRPTVGTGSSSSESLPREARQPRPPFERVSGADLLADLSLVQDIEAQKALQLLTGQNRFPETILSQVRKFPLLPEAGEGAESGGGGQGGTKTQGVEDFVRKWAGKAGWYTGDLTDKAYNKADEAIVSAHRFFTNSGDSEVRQSLYLLALARRLGVNLKSIAHFMQGAQPYQKYMDEMGPNPTDTQKAEARRLLNEFASGLNRELESAIAKAQRHQEKAQSNLSQKAGQLGGELSVEQIESILNHLLLQGVPSSSIANVINSLKITRAEFQRSGMNAHDYLLTKLTDSDTHAALSSSVIQLQSLKFNPEGISSPYTRDETTMAFLSEALGRASAVGHSLDTGAYIHRHISEPVMRMLEESPEIKVKIFEGRAGHVLQELQRQGFTEIRPLNRNAFTDFDKFLAVRPSADGKPGETALIVVTQTGRAYPREAAGHFIYYQKHGRNVIDPKRVEIFRSSQDNPRREFGELISEEGLKPDIIVMGNVAQFQRLINEGKAGPQVREVRTIARNHFFGVVFEINGREVLVVKVEPFLYSDRAGEFLRAVNDTGKKPVVIFTGTAGALDPSMRINDIVVPGIFTDANQIQARPVAGASNQAVTVISAMIHESKPEGLYFGDRVVHGAVDSILLEDKLWLRSHRGQRGQSLSSVEQEAADLALAAKEGGNQFYAYFRISDLVGTEGADFSQNEVIREKSRALFGQSEITMEILRQVTLTPKPAVAQAPPSPARGAGIESSRRETFMVENPGGKPKFRFRVNGFDALSSVQPSAAASLENDLSLLLSKESLGDEVPMTERLQTLGNIAIKVQQRYGVSIQVETIP